MISYKLNFLPTHLVCKSIEDSSDKITESRDKLETSFPKIIESFQELKKIKPEFDKSKIQISNLKEYRPKLQDMYEEKREAILHSNNNIYHLSVRVLNEIHKSIKELKKIMFNADSLIYRENKILNKLSKKVNSSGTEKITETLISEINKLKSDIKSVARKLFESAKAEEKDLFPKSEEESRQKAVISDQIKKQGIEIDEVGKILQHLNLDDIDDFTKNSEKELENIERIHLEVIDLIQKFGNYLNDMKNELYLLEEETDKKLREKLVDVESFFDKTKAEITKNAKSLFLNIRFVEGLELNSESKN